MYPLIITIIIAILCLTVMLLLRIFKIDVRLQERDQSNLNLRESINEHQLLSMKLLQESIQNGMADIRLQVTALLTGNTETINQSINQLTSNTDQRLKEISGEVEKRLAEGFVQTNSLFTDVVKRLALIDEAQKQISDLSSNVIDLQTILADKRSRGSFGEVQLTALIRNIIPENHFALQHPLSNGKRADCILFLPEPTGNIIIDAKFPLENYRRLTEGNLPESEKHAIEQQFRADIRKHLQDIASKYIIAGETADSAVMFIPAEAVFAEIHAHYHDLIELSHQLRVWMVSPTTMMAVLTTVRAVLKDAATKKQIHIIREHLNLLGQDFSRFQKRMDNLASHIKNAHEDMEQVHISSKKISARFTKIEHAELEANPDNLELGN